MIKLEHVVLTSPEQMEKDIPNHPGFKARTDGTIIGKRGRPMKGHVDRCGYREVLLSENGKTNNARVHRLMAETFIPNPYNLRDVNHKDGNKLNNNISNLEWVSHSGNVKHAYDNGLEKKLLGENHHAHKLTKEAVKDIRQNYKRYSRENGAGALARKYSVDKSTVQAVLNNETWRDD